MIGRAIFNKAPLEKNHLAALPVGAIAPQGWLEKQLQVAASGLTGRLYEFWPDVRDSAWRGGEGDGWERAPYYLDGLVPLAYILKDERLIEACRPYIEWTLNSQREDGFFGPQKSEDWWPRMVMMKVLISYYTATADRRVPEFIYRYLKYQYLNLDQMPLKEWAVARGGDNIQAVVWMYNLTGKPFLLKLMQKLRDQTLDWTSHFAAFPFTRSMAELLPWQEMVNGKSGEPGGLYGMNRPYYSTQYHLSHVVNVAMGLKTPGMIHQFKSGTKELEGFANGYQKLMRYHGVAYGMFTGDEHLSGASPTQGTECCAVVELMYTLESLLASSVAAQGLGDILEKLAYNALPATLTSDMLGHQYDQQANQVASTLAKRNWYNNNDEANLFGLAPHFGCCTANMHQGWPKFCASLWYATEDDGFAAIAYAPCVVRFQSAGTPVKLTVDTAYPFEEHVRIRVDVGEEKRFPIELRIPEWAAHASLVLPDGERLEPEAGRFARVERLWKSGDTLELCLPMTARVTRWKQQSAAVEVGPLLMAFQPHEIWTKRKEHPVSPDWEVTTDEAWNWALLDGEPLEIERNPEAAGPFGQGCALRVKTRCARVEQWGMDGASCATPPILPKVCAQDVREINLVPYGDTNLHITQFPLATIEDEE